MTRHLDNTIAKRAASHLLIGTAGFMPSETKNRPTNRPSRIAGQFGTVWRRVPARRIPAFLHRS